MAETAVLTLTDFLLARIAEDEATAKAASGGLDYNWGDYGINPELLVDARFFERFASPARVLAKCKADRLIVEEHSRGEYLSGAYCECCCTTSDATGEPWGDWPCLTLAALALPYANHHPDYRAEWRP